MSVTRLPPRNPGRADDPLTRAFRAGEVVIVRIPGVRIVVPLDGFQLFISPEAETYQE